LGFSRQKYKVFLKCAKGILDFGFSFSTIPFFQLETGIFHYIVIAFHEKER